MTGQVYTLGYAVAGAAEQLERLMADPTMLLVDVRKEARSRWLHQWTKKQLTLRWGGRYIHLPQLGNVNYKDRNLPIVLANPDEGIPVVQSYLQAGYSVVLLCACMRYETCHRRVVAELLEAQSAAATEGT
jgi:uncharacterized protein (DUF488 family)